MTKPKVYPEGLTSWLNLEYRFQGGSRMCLYSDLSVIEGARHFVQNGRQDVWLLTKEGVNCSSFLFKEAVNPRSEQKKCSYGGIVPFKIFMRELGYETTLQPFVLKCAAMLAHDLNRCPTSAELRASILSNTLPQGFAAWKSRLKGDQATRNMRDLLKQCSLQWLPRQVSQSSIIEVKPPYGSQKLLKIALPFYIGGNGPVARLLERHIPIVKMYIQLPPGYQEPSKRRRGRPLKGE